MASTFRFHSMQSVPAMARTGASARPSTCLVVGSSNFTTSTGALPSGVARGRQVALLRSLQVTMPRPYSPAQTVRVGATLRGLFGDSGTANDVMDTIVSELKRSYLENSVKLGLDPDRIAEFLLLGPAAALVGNDGVNDAARANLERDGNYIKQLDGSLRQRVNTDASYSLDRWKGFAKNVADDVTQQGGAAWDSSLLALAPSSVVLAAKATGKQIESAAESALPWVAGAAILGGGAYLLVVTGAIGPLLGRFFRKRSTSPGFAGLKSRRKGSKRRKSARR